MIEKSALTFSSPSFFLSVLPFLYISLPLVYLYLCHSPTFSFTFILFFILCCLSFSVFFFLFTTDLSFFCIFYIFFLPLSFFNIFSLSVSFFIFLSLASFLVSFSLLLLNGLPLPLFLLMLS